MYNDRFKHVKLCNALFRHIPPIPQSHAVSIPQLLCRDLWQADLANTILFFLTSIAG